MEVRPGYKQTELGVIPEDWAVEDIAACAESASGTTPARAAAERYFHDGTIPWVKTLDLNNSVIKETDECVTETALRETSLKLYPAGSVLVAMYGGFAQIGRTGYLPFPATINQALTAICPEGRKLDSKYLIYFLNYHVGYWKSVASSSRKDPNITGNDVRKFPISLPPIKEQRAIATALSDMDALLDSLTRLIAKKRDLKQATMQQLLTGQTRLPGFSGGWEVKRLGDHLTFLKNGVNSRAELTAAGKVKYLHYGDIHGATGLLLKPGVTLMPHLPVGKAGQLDRLSDGDLVFADASEDLDGVGKSVELKNVGQFEVVSGLHTIAVRFDKQVLADGFKAYLQFIPVFRQHLRRLVAGTKVYATNRAHIASAEMALPDVHEQTAIAAVLADMDAELAVLDARLTKTRALKQAMMSELLTGKTRLPT